MLPVGACNSQKQRTPTCPPPHSVSMLSPLLHLHQRWSPRPANAAALPPPPASCSHLTALWCGAFWLVRCHPAGTVYTRYTVYIGWYLPFYLQPDSLASARGMLHIAGGLFLWLNAVYNFICGVARNPGAPDPAVVPCTMTSTSF